MSEYNGSTSSGRGQPTHFAKIAREIRDSGILPKLGRTEQIVLFCVADMARWDMRSPDYRTCYFSKPKLAEELGIAPRTVYSAIKSLVDRGILSAVGKHPIRINGALAYELPIYRVAEPVDLYDIVHGIWKPESARPMDEAALKRLKAAKANRQTNTSPDNRSIPSPDPVGTSPQTSPSHLPPHGDHTPPDPVGTQKVDVEVAVEVEEEKEGYPLAENGGAVNDRTSTEDAPTLPGKARFNALKDDLTSEQFHYCMQFVKDKIAAVEDRFEKDRIVNQICDVIEVMTAGYKFHVCI